ncbi:Lipid II flippase FtsW [Candidatus Fokinia solitaria]|uniref:Probable peptidoglycan glycosyltransferase FtsW n=2 Tax=Candidatus Fokinia solitaria TaxID=1802984 RepID=A0A2U8BSM4_9RICK|nr:Lipid II flippase FtsW [Candidatus Fokinia solitaria]
MDYLTVVVTFILCGIGLLLLSTASPASTQRLSISEPFHFFHRQLVFTLIGFVVLFATAFANRTFYTKVAYVCFIIGVALLLAVLVFGEVVNGSKRWLNILGFSIQPTELLKPFYVIVIARLMSKDDFVDNAHYVFLFHAVIALLIVVQPDFGMAMTFTAVFFMQLLCSNLSFSSLTRYILLTSSILPLAYITLPHVRKRVALFLRPNTDQLSLGYQSTKSMLSYIKGSWFGSGLGEGKIKYQLPDSHTDYIFAVAAEEFGAILCCVVVMLYAIVVTRGMIKAIRSTDKFCMLVIIGCIGYIAFQSIFNISVTLSILPSKGMTLPLISYGGSAMIGTCVLLGTYLNYSKQIISKKRINAHIHM